MVILLAAATLIAFIPLTGMGQKAFAATATVATSVTINYDGDSTVTLNSSTPYWKNGEAAATAAESASGYNACLKEGVLTLNGISISSSNSDIITADGDLTIHEIGRNVICKYVPNGHTNIKVNGSLIVEGDPGSVLLVDVRLYGNDDTPSADAIDCSGDFTLKSGGLYAAAILGDAIKAANVNVTGGELTAEFCSSGYSAIRAERDGTLGNVNISGGTVIAAEPWNDVGGGTGITAARVNVGGGALYAFGGIKNTTNNSLSGNVLHLNGSEQVTDITTASEGNPVCDNLVVLSDETGQSEVVTKSDGSKITYDTPFIICGMPFTAATAGGKRYGDFDQSAAHKYSWSASLPTSAADTYHLSLNNFAGTHYDIQCDSQNGLQVTSGGTANIIDTLDQTGQLAINNWGGGSLTITGQSKLILNGNDGSISSGSDIVIDKARIECTTGSTFFAASDEIPGIECGRKLTISDSSLQIKRAELVERNGDINYSPYNGIDAPEVVLNSSNVDVHSEANAVICGNLTLNGGTLHAETVYSRGLNISQQFLITDGTVVVEGLTSGSSGGIYHVPTYAYYTPLVTYGETEASGTLAVSPAAEAYSSSRYVKIQRFYPPVITSNPVPMVPAKPIILLKTINSGRDLKLSWTEVEGATKYVIYGSKCGIGSKYAKLRTVSAPAASYTFKDLKLHKSYKYYVAAYSDAGRLCLSRTTHTAVGSSFADRYNATKVSVSDADFSLAVGASAQIKAKVATSAGRTLFGDGHCAITRFVVSDSSVASVSKTGEIKAVSKGTATVYVLAPDGVRAEVKVTVK